jgi:LysR family transcriptional regulator, nitrogen assimilation regulatory protein
VIKSIIPADGGRKVDLKQVDYFLSLAREGNMTRAARQLNIVQPALSMQIAKLETSFGKRLFNRTAHGVSLTSAGEALLQLATGIRREVDHAEEEMARLDGNVSGRVRVGMIASAAQCTLAASSAKVATRYPEIRLMICEGYTDQLIDWVTSGELDVALINMPKRRLPLTVHHILDERMMFAYGKKNRTRFPKNVPFEQLGRLDLILPSRRHGLRLILDSAASEAGVTLHPRLEVDTLAAICEIVAATDLVSVLPGVALYPLYAAGRIRGKGIVSPTIVRTVSWVTNPRRIVSAATAAVVEILAGDLTDAAKSVSQRIR